MTRPVAITRALIVTLVTAVVGAIVVTAVFSFGEVEPTIRDLGDEESRVNIVWWGLTAAASCVATLLGVIAGGMALTSTSIDVPWRAVLLIGAVVGGLGTAIAGALLVSGVLPQHTAVPMLAGLLIGVAGGAAYVLQRGAPDRDLSWYVEEQRQSKAWGSR